jgi:hypothetical protein
VNNGGHTTAITNWGYQREKESPFIQWGVLNEQQLSKVQEKVYFNGGGLSMEVETYGIGTFGTVYE